MKKFLILYQAVMSAEQTMATATTDEMKAGMDTWNKWKVMTQGQGVSVEFGAPLKGRKVIKNSESVSASESDVSGYSFMEALSVDDVVKALKEHPHLKVAGNSIEVLELLPMPRSS